MAFVRCETAHVAGLADRSGDPSPVTGFGVYMGMKAAAKRRWLAAGRPLPMPIGSLDAIHLATALIWRDRMGPLPEVATHDTALGAAARAFGFEVRGV